MESLETDVLVVGAGAAGLCAAIHAAPRRVLLLAPQGTPGTCTELAHGGIAAPLAAGDSVAQHVADTIVAADHSASEQCAGSIIGTAAEAIGFLQAAGVQFDRCATGHDLHLEAGHGMARILHADGDRTGAAIHRALLAVARASAHIVFGDDALAISLLRGRHGIAGVLALRAAGRPCLVHAAETVLATGGLGQLFDATTNSRAATGDGLAMALAHGARVAGLEFVQFHPTALRSTVDPLPLLTEALRGAGAMLVADGRRFMPAIDTRGDLAPRDIVARAVWHEQQRGADVRLDARAVFAGTQACDFPAARAACLALGIDPAETPAPVTCAAHFHMGGIVIDAQGRSSIPGLWAAGEVAYTGLHGANRLASNSLLEAVVVGSAAGRAIARGAWRHPEPLPWRAEEPQRLPQNEQWQALRSLMGRALGPVRHGRELKLARASVLELLETVPARFLQLRQRFALASAMIAAALRRTESRGAHCRSDFVMRNPALDGSGALLAYSRPVQAGTQHR